MKILVGNDVIDLTCLQNRSAVLSDRYLQKQYTNAERDQIWTTKDPTSLMWLLFSCKESAFKVISKTSCKAQFHPKGIAVEIDLIGVDKDIEIWRGSSYHKGNVVFHISHKHNDWIHTLASNHYEAMSLVYTRRMKILPDMEPSQIIRRGLLGFLRKCSYHNDYEIRGGGLAAPELHQIDGQYAGDISFSHDQSIAAFAYLPPFSNLINLME